LDANPSLSKDFVCCAVQYPPKATSNFRNRCETSSIESNRLRKDRSIPNSPPTLKFGCGWLIRGSRWMGRKVGGRPGGTCVGGSAASILDQATLKPGLASVWSVGTSSCPF
jgi:hypothetical protein